MLKHLCIVALLGTPLALWAQKPESLDYNKFRQLGTELPTPNTYRTASGAPGHQYWQQRADYIINAELDDARQTITGRETITYFNNSPDVLTYLWVQLDQNHFSKASEAFATETGTMRQRMSTTELKRQMAKDASVHGFTITEVSDRLGKPLPNTVVHTMMRIDLPTPLGPGQQFVLNIAWNYVVTDHAVFGGRTGYEYFAADDNRLYEVAQWFPRMAVYGDADGWIHKQFLGRSEFTLPFGNYRVSLTAPADFVVGATGELQNPTQVLTPTQQQRLAQARQADVPTLIITQDEAKANETSRATGKKTWTYYAQNVRDFAWAASRKFIWDGMGVNVGGKRVLAMSYYPKEGNPLWGQYSTESVAHTLRVYSKHTIDYPYPVAISVHGPIFGMEYPMICFNGGRPEADGTYPERTKYALISVIIHEVGHNFFPMIVNSDERNWTWMDEGLNTFCQYLAEQEWDRNYPSRRGPAYTTVDYMKAGREVQDPIMTNGESVIAVGPNAYTKPAAALNVLRETVLGRKLFDYAFKEYARRWAFRHPTPADFFRTMEDASGVDLDWFWRGWFYSTEHVDISLDNVTYYQIDTQDPERERSRQVATSLSNRENLIGFRNNKTDLPQTAVETRPSLKDFYNAYDSSQAQPWEKARYQAFWNGLTPEEQALAQRQQHWYQLDFVNEGGVVMPLILRFEFEDGSEAVRRIPAEIWRLNNNRISKVFTFDKPLKTIELDPYGETADADLTDNAFPRAPVPTRFQLFKQQQQSSPNPMQQLPRRNDTDRP